ncbi:MAG: Coenzyme A biosynthesis bifunctional protein CoaBC [Calditrichaeota bacterium]|nr:Coenzyme A biosynthesis bifunctional protein CoaBC [Calditrichota bacterium]
MTPDGADPAAPPRDLSGRRVLVVVSGGIAAYKTVDVVRRLLKRGAEMRVIMTRAATRFLHPNTFASITGRRVALDLFRKGGEPDVDHLELPHRAELILIAPATANLLAKYAHGIADDLASTALLAAQCPVLAAPAMNPSMWTHPATIANLRALKERGVLTIGPNRGEMAAPGEESGEGRMSEPHEIEAEIVRILTGDETRSLSGKTILITAGRTEEPVDRVRVLTNRSSGRMGVALAEAAVKRGAQVVLVHGAMDVPPPAGVRAVHAPTAREMLEQVNRHAGDADAAIYVAAVSDWRPERAREGKLKREQQAGASLSLALVENPDIAAETAGLVNGVTVGFALEVGDAIDSAREKMRRKHLDAILLNRVETIGAERATLTWITGSETSVLGPGDKRELAERVLDHLHPLLIHGPESR